MSESVLYTNGEVVRAGDVSKDETWQQSRVVLVGGAIYPGMCGCYALYGPI